MLKYDRVRIRKAIDHQLSSFIPRHTFHTFMRFCFSYFCVKQHELTIEETISIQLFNFDFCRRERVKEIIMKGTIDYMKRL